MLVWKHRCVYHLTQASNWPSIQQHGLLSTSTLLDLAGFEGSDRYEIERRQRLEGRTLPNGAVIRDQTPIPPAALTRCLANGLTPEDWYAELNGRVFFWLDHRRLNRQRRASRSLLQMVLVVDADALLFRYARSAALTPFNTGNARRRPARRGRETFVPYDEWRESGWFSEAKGLRTKLRASSHKPVELTIREAVGDIMDFVIEVRQLGKDEYLAL